jgi:transposase-like protein
MGKRDAQLVTQALYTLVDAREAIENGHSDAALDALGEVYEVLISVKHTPGMSVAAASEQLGVSEPTIRNWVKRGALSAVPKVSPMQIEPESLHRVSRALSELRERGQDRDWLQAVVDYLHDREVRKSDAVKGGIAQLPRGQLEPA